MITLLSSVKERGRAARARSIVEPQPPIKARIAPLAASLPSGIDPWGARASHASTTSATASTPLPTRGQLVLNRVRHAAADVALEGADPAQVADLPPQRRLGGTADSFAQVRQAQRAVEVGPENGDAERRRDE